jgi:DNA-directed RNA polymerase specialized sigma24 family protein
MHRDPKTSERQIKRSAFRAYRKHYYAFAGSMEVSDLEQEFWAVWAKAVHMFDPDNGSDFGAYLQVALNNHCIRLMQKKWTEYRVVQPLPAVIGEDGSVMDVVGNIADEATLSPETELFLKRRREDVRRLADPRVLKILEVLEDPPESIRKEVQAMRAKGLHAKEMGLSGRYNPRLTMLRVFDLFGVNRTYGIKLIKDLKEALNDD